MFTLYTHWYHLEKCVYIIFIFCNSVYGVRRLRMWDNHCHIIEIVIIISTGKCVETYFSLCCDYPPLLCFYFIFSYQKKKKKFVSHIKWNYARIIKTNALYFKRQLTLLCKKKTMIDFFWILGISRKLKELPVDASPKE